MRGGEREMNRERHDCWVNGYFTHLTTQLQIIQLDEDRGEFVLRATFDHPYPTTKIMWIPDQTAQLPDLVATSGDYLRLWRVTESQVRQECMLNNVSSIKREHL